jgi:CysZ protein
MLGRSIRGATLPLRALRLIARAPQTWRLILIPIAINCIVGLLLYSSLLYGGLRAIDGLVANLPEWLQGLGALLGVLLGVLLFVAIAFLLVRFGVLLGSPFYGQLSQQVEQELTGAAPADTPLTVAGVAHDLWRALQFELKKIALVLACAPLLLVIGLIPAVGATIAAAGSIALGVVISCLDFTDGPLERRRLRFRRKLGAIRAGMPASAAFGLVALGLISIPLINLLSIPLCVVAGTILYCEEIAPRM